MSEGPLSPLEKYAVGYGKPPVEGQWKKGQSGNPSGKKKGTQNSKTLFLDACQEKVQVGGGKVVTLLEAFITALPQKAAAGNIAAFTAHCSLLDKFAVESVDKPKPYVVCDADGSVAIMHPVKLSDKGGYEIKELVKKITALLTIPEEEAGSDIAESCTKADH